MILKFSEKYKKSPPIEGSVGGELTELLIGGGETWLYKSLIRLPLVYQIIHKVYSHYLLFYVYCNLANKAFRYTYTFSTDGK